MVSRIVSKFFLFIPCVSTFFYTCRFANIIMFLCNIYRNSLFTVDPCAKGHQGFFVSYFCRSISKWVGCASSTTCVETWFVELPESRRHQRSVSPVSQDSDSTPHHQNSRAPHQNSHLSHQKSDLEEENTDGMPPSTGYKLNGIPIPEYLARRGLWGVRSGAKG